jgi:hypothetical protein
MVENLSLPPPFGAVVGFGIRDRKKSGSGIRDKHPGSATLVMQTLEIWMMVDWDKDKCLKT